jgi:hypothetical protein
MDVLKIFINTLLDGFQNPIVIVSGSTDLEFPRDFLDIWYKIETSDKILNFFCQNCTIKTRKIQNIPIGLDYHCISYNTEWLSYGYKNISPVIQEKMIYDVKNSLLDLVDPKIQINKCATNFHLAMDYERRSKVRIPAYNILKNNNCIEFLSRLPRYEYFKKLNDYAFTISPSGNGLDTHRTWESLILNRIPIVNDTGLQVYDDLPIIQIKDWTIISEEWLKTKYNEIIQKFNNNQFNLGKLYLKYWTNLFNQYKK